MKSLFIIAVVLALLCIKAEAQTSADAFLQASNQLNSTRQFCKPYYPSYGATSFEQINDADLGIPIQCYTIKGVASDPLTNRLALTTEWLVPVIYSNKPFNIIEVTLHNGKWETRFCTSTFKELSVVRAHWPESKGFHPKFIVCPAYAGYFFNIPEAPIENLTDMHDMLWQHPPELSPIGIHISFWGR